MSDKSAGKKSKSLAAELELLRAENARLRAEIEETERFYDVIGLMSSEMFWKSDDQHRFTYMSPAVVEAVDVSMAEQLGKTRAELSDDDLNSPRWQKHLEDLAAHRPFRNFRYSRRHKSGQIREITVTGRPIFDSNGVFHGHAGVASDITDRLQTEAKVKSAEDTLMTAINALDCIFIIWDSEDQLVFCNEKFLELNAEIPDACQFGITFSEHLQAVTENGLIGTDEDKTHWYESRLEKHRNPRGAFEINRQNGITILVNEAKLADGSTITLSMDISPQKAIERALRETQKKLLDYSSTGADWFWEMDADLRYSYISVDNPAVTGLEVVDQIGKTHREIRPIKYNEAKLKAFEEILNNREPFSDIRFSRLALDGTELHMAISGKPVFDNNGVFSGYRGGGRNIGKLFETELALRREKERAELASRAKSEFLAHMSHELRTPLNAILGFSDIIREQIFGPVGVDAYREYAGDIHRSGEHLLSLINDLLDLSKIEAGKFALDEEELLLSEIIEQSERLFSHRFAQRRIRYTKKISDDIDRIFADRRAMTQIIFNILSNAEKFNMEGGKVDVTVYRENTGGISFSIKDSGCGFLISETDTALAPFGRIANPMTKGTPGTGLGLPIVRSLMDLHKGNLKILSTPGVGTEVILEFPPERTITRNA